MSSSPVNNLGVPPGMTPETWDRLRKSPLMAKIELNGPSATDRLKARSRALMSPKKTKKDSLEHYRWSYLKKGGKNDTTVKKLLYQTQMAIESKDEKQECLSEIQFATENLKFEVFEEKAKEKVAAATSIGGKPINEDDYCSSRVQLKGVEAHFYGVFDGHTDRGRCASLVAKELPARIEKLLVEAEEISETTITNAITKAIGQLEEKWDGEGGTTATCALKIGEQIYLINVGDSRTILVKKESVYPLTEDASPGEARFKRAVKKMGGMVMRWPPGSSVFRVNAESAVARDIGYGSLSAQPKISLLSAGKAEDKDLPEEGRLFYREGDYLVLASDGLWNDATTQEVGKAIQWMDSKGATPNQMALALAQETQDLLLGAHGGVDNVTVMVVKL